MRTTADYVDALRVRFAVPSDYALRGATGWSRQQTSRYRQKKTTFDDDTAAKVAGWLSMELAVVLVDMNVQRAKRTVIREAWTSLAKMAGALAAGLVIAFAVVSVLDVSVKGGAVAFDASYTLYEAGGAVFLWAFFVTVARAWVFSMARR